MKAPKRWIGSTRTICDENRTKRSKDIICNYVFQPLGKSLKAFAELGCKGVGEINLAYEKTKIE